jgi:hypothetical protein
MERRLTWSESASRFDSKIYSPVNKLISDRAICGIESWKPGRKAQRRTAIGCEVGCKSASTEGDKLQTVERTTAGSKEKKRGWNRFQWISSVFDPWYQRERKSGKEAEGQEKGQWRWKAAERSKGRKRQKEEMNFIDIVVVNIIKVGMPPFWELISCKNCWKSNASAAPENFALHGLHKASTPIAVEIFWCNRNMRICKIDFDRQAFYLPATTLWRKNLL